MSELMKFDFNGHNLSAQIDENSQGLFLAKEACECMGLKNVSRALERLDDDEKLTLPIVMSGQTRNMWHVTEPGMYQLAFLSRTKQAKEFKRWLAHDVIPAIRRKKISISGFSPEAAELINKAAGAITVLRSSNQALYRENTHLREMEKLREQNAKIGKPLLPEEKARIADYVALGYDAQYITRLLNRRSDCAVRSYLKKIQAHDAR